MSDWPSAPALPDATALVGTMTLHSVAAVIGGATVASTVWPTANLAIFTPFRVTAPVLAAYLWMANGAAVSGNVDVGIYDAAGTLLVSAGSTAQAGTTTVQTFNITDKVIGPGLFYFAMAFDNTTATNRRLGFTTANAGLCQCLGMAQMASAFPLPATATFASCANPYVPAMGLSSKSTV